MKRTELFRLSLSQPFGLLGGLLGGLLAFAGFGLLFGMFGVHVAPAQEEQPVEKVKLVPLYPNLEFERTVSLVVPPDDSKREFLVLQGGTIEILPENRESDTSVTWMDITDREMIENKFEEGLLGLAFHPGFKENGKFYIFYSLQGPKVSRVSEFVANGEDRATVDYASERVLLEIPQPFWNHNSGNILFGPDGMLYIGVGDGGKRDGVHNLSQNRFVLNGKILRIDVEGRTGRLPYGIPADNPFVKEGGTRPEIYSLGMRNPWGLAFTESGTLICADVGQEHWEEINVILPGKNYGWNFREGDALFYRRPGDPAEGAVFEDPVFQYDHTQGISITGGYVYRGEALPELQGKYIFGDWGFGTVWALNLPEDGGKATAEVIYKNLNVQKKKGFKPTAFCEGADGEMRALSWMEGVFGFGE